MTMNLQLIIHAAGDVKLAQKNMGGLDDIQRRYRSMVVAEKTHGRIYDEL